VWSNTSNLLSKLLALLKWQLNEELMFASRSGQTRAVVTLTTGPWKVCLITPCILRRILTASITASAGSVHVVVYDWYFSGDVNLLCGKKQFRAPDCLHCFVKGGERPLVLCSRAVRCRLRPNL
jgi:hypothetical protein